MSHCFAYGCSHRAMKDACRFFKFPKCGGREFNEWKSLSRRADAEPTEFSVLCSCHFPHGEKSNGPSIFPWTESKAFGDFNSPEKRSRKKRMACSNDSAIRGPLASCLEQQSNPSGAASGENFPEDAALKMEEMAAEIASLKSQLDLEKFRKAAGNVLKYEDIRRNGRLLRYYTGLPSECSFELLLKWCRPDKLKYHEGWVVTKIPPCDQLLLTLVKLRLNLDFTDLSVRFQVSMTTVRNVFITFLHALHATLFRLIQMPSTKKNQACLSASFSSFSNCRCIVDCTEIQCAKPRESLQKQSETFSNYKQRHTMKGLVACSPHGVITFMSDLYPGSNSDKSIFEDSKICDLLQAGDLILADKGFLIQSLLPQGVSVNIPPFLKEGRLTRSEVRVTTEIARARIHVERVIGRIKNYNVLEFMPVNLRQYASLIFQVVGGLANLHMPLCDPDNEEENNWEHFHSAT